MAVYSGYLPQGTNLYAGDYLTSPDGLYYGVLDTAGASGYGPGLFVVAPGSNPTLAPVRNCAACSYPVTTTPTANLGGFFAQLGSDGNFVVYSSPTGQNQGQVIPVSSTSSAQTPANPPYYAAILDSTSKASGNSAGSFIIYQGAYPGTSNPLFLDSQNILGAVTGITLSGGASGTGIDYDFSKAKLGSVHNVASQATTVYNGTAQTQQYNINLSLGYTDSQTFSFQVSDATAVSINSSVTVGVPGLVGTTVQVGLSSTTTISKGQSTTTSNNTTFQAGVRPEVPPGYTYEAFISGVDAAFSVPFTWSGIATYAGGASAAVSGSGLFNGDQTGLLRAQVYCLQAPAGSPPCPSLPLIDQQLSAVPEPGTVLLLAAALPLGLIMRRRLAAGLRRGTGSGQAGARGAGMNGVATPERGPARWPGASAAYAARRPRRAAIAA